MEKQIGQINLLELLSMLKALQGIFQARLKTIDKMINEISVLADNEESIIDESILSDEQKKVVSILRRGL